MKRVNEREFHIVMNMYEDRLLHSPNDNLLEYIINEDRVIGIIVLLENKSFYYVRQ